MISSKNTNKKNLLTEKHYQKVSFLSVSLLHLLHKTLVWSSHVNYAVKTSMIKMQLSNVMHVTSGYIWGVINLTFLTIKVFHELIFSLVYHVAVISLAQYLIKFTMNYPVKTALPSWNHLLIWHSYLVHWLYLPYSNKLILKMLWILDTLTLTKSNQQNFSGMRNLCLSPIWMHVH